MTNETRTELMQFLSASQAGPVMNAFPELNDFERARFAKAFCLGMVMMLNPDIYQTVVEAKALIEQQAAR